MNSYLDSYPNGTLLNLEQYASQVGALDFQCGIGKICNPGQLCQAVKGQDWYALVVAQNWNNFVNMLYQASGDAFDVIADILPEMLVDLEKDPSRAPRHFTAWVGLVGTWVSSFPASLFKSFGVIPGTIWSWGTISWLSIVMVLYNITAFGWVNTLIIRGNGEDRFKRSSSISWMLGEAQQVVQRIIANITQVILQSGISTEQGLASVNRDGLFLSGTPVTDRASIQKEYEEVLKLRTLVKLWRCQNVFIVRGAEPCTQEGENGAFGDPGRLSYCGDDAIMMSIVRVNSESDEVDPFIFGAPLVAKKYGFTTEYLTTTSWQCQHKYGVFEFDPHFFRNMTNAHNLNIQKDCTVNLPVCDFTRTDMHEALENGQSIVEACRLIAGLPI